jgi:hypothetical protein
MNQGSAGARAIGSDGSGGHGDAVADDPRVKAQRPSAAQGGAAHGIAAAAAPVAVPAAAIPKGHAAADARSVDLDVQYADHYLCRAMPIVLFINHRRVLVNVEQLLMSCNAAVDARGIEYGPYHRIVDEKMRCCFSVVLCL